MVEDQRKLLIDMPFFTYTQGGPQGPAGLSAYEIAVLNGFVGTETDWLASLQGEAGPQGDSSAVSVEFVQNTPSDVWVINHFLHFRPNINVVDNNGEVVYCQIVHNSKIQAVVTFAQPTTGVATCS